MGHAWSTLEGLCSAYFLLHKGIGAFYVNNLVTLYESSSVYIGQNLVDQ